MSTTLIVILCCVGSVLFLLFILPLMMKGKYAIEKTIDINKPLSEVREKIVNLNYYRDWNPWQKSEPSSTQKIEGAPDTPGHRYSWEGKKIGVGSLTLSKNGRDHVEFDLEFIKPWASKAKDEWHFEDKGGSTKVIWKNEGPLAYPIARLMGPMINKQLNHQFEAGLRNLKSLCETGRS